MPSFVIIYLHSALALNEILQYPDVNAYGIERLNGQVFT